MILRPFFLHLRLRPLPLFTPRPLLINPVSVPPTSTPANPSFQRHYAAKTPADIVIEELQELYATARDEFEIAIDSTSKNTTYAVEDRAAAMDEFEKLQRAYREAVDEGEETREGGEKEFREEVKRRVGMRVRELERGIEAMEEGVRERGG